MSDHPIIYPTFRELAAWKFWIERPEPKCLYIPMYQNPQIFDSFAGNWDSGNILTFSPETPVLPRK